MREKIAEILESLVKMELTYKQANDAILAIIASEQAPLIEALKMDRHVLKSQGYVSEENTLLGFIDAALEGK